MFRSIVFSSHSWLAIGGFVGAGCGGDDAPSEPTNLYALELGTGESSFEPLTPGQHVQMVAGTQGGFHVWLSLRSKGFSDARLRMQLMLQPSGPAPLAASDLQISFDAAADPVLAMLGEREHVGWPAQLLSPWCAVEQSVTIAATVTDLAGHSASATLQIVPTAPAHGFPQSCTP